MTALLMKVRISIDSRTGFEDPFRFEDILDTRQREAQGVATRLPATPVSAIRSMLLSTNSHLFVRAPSKIFNLYLLRNVMTMVPATLKRVATEDGSVSPPPTKRKVQVSTTSEGYTFGRNFSKVTNMIRQGSSQFLQACVSEGTE